MFLACHPLSLEVACTIPLITFSNCLVFYGFCTLITYWIGDPTDKVDNDFVRQKCKQYLKIAFGGDILVSILTILAYFKYENDLQISFSILFTYFLSGSILLWKFIWKARQHIFMKMRYHFRIVVLLTLFGLYALSRWDTCDGRPCPIKKPLTSLFRILMVITIAPRIVDFYVVLLGNVCFFETEEFEKRGTEYLRVHYGIEVTRESDEEDSDDEDEPTFDANLNFKSLECQVCLKRYDGELKYRIPRILTKCGHTVCTGCAKRLWRTKFEIDAICPFCDKTTYVGDSVEKLEKNHVFIALIQELRQTIGDGNKFNHEIANEA